MGTVVSNSRIKELYAKALQKYQQSQPRQMPLRTGMASPGPVGRTPVGMSQPGGVGRSMVGSAPPQMMGGARPVMGAAPNQLQNAQLAARIYGRRP